MEARVGIEPTNRGFAVPGLTTWLPRHAPKHLLSIDFPPLEQAKILLHLTTYEISHLFQPCSFHVWFCLRAEPPECHYRNGGRYGLVGYWMLW